MCGIAGIISKNNTDISGNILNMLGLIQHRGPDASGVAVFEEKKGNLLRVSMNEEGKNEVLKNIIQKYGTIIQEKMVPAVNSIPLVEYEIHMDTNQLTDLHFEINEQEGLCVHSIGENLRVYKEGGLIQNLLDKHDIDHRPCHHGIGHVRMATESAEDINAAHPFVSPFFPGMAMVHNGQFTNYFKMRRFLEAKGVKFKTMNDSEAACHLIAYAMSINGGDLEQALHYAGDYMDGIYCIIAATENQIGFVKDKLGIKPLLAAECEDYVLLGSEQIEFTAVKENVFAEEMEPGEVRVWNV